MLTSWELTGRTGHQRLAYRQVLSGTVPAEPAGPDRGYVYGAGVGYRIGESLRLGVDTNYYTRRSESGAARLEGCGCLVVIRKQQTKNRSAPAWPALWGGYRRKRPRKQLTARTVMS